MEERRDGHFYCKFTEEVDKYRLPYITKDDDMKSMFRTYLWRTDLKACLNGSNSIIAFRSPGATRGHLVVEKVDDKLIIKDIFFYEDTCFSESIGCYEESVLEIIQDFIGKELE